MSEVYSLKLDPTGHYEGVPQKGLHASLGLIPTLCHSVSLSTPKDVGEAYDLLQDEYGFGRGSDGDPEEWGTVTEDGNFVSKYPEDSDLYPLAKMQLTDPEGTNIHVYQYRYGIIAVTDGTDLRITKMD